MLEGPPDWRVPAALIAVLVAAMVVGLVIALVSLSIQANHP
jgi:flagellar biosynthesis protein FliQ